MWAWIVPHFAAFEGEIVHVLSPHVYEVSYANMIENQSTYIDEVLSFSLEATTVSSSNAPAGAYQNDTMWFDEATNDSSTLALRALIDN